MKDGKKKQISHQIVFRAKLRLPDGHCVFARIPRPVRSGLKHSCVKTLVPAGPAAPKAVVRRKLAAKPTLRHAVSTQVAVPPELGGKWIAWDRGMTRILASGETPEQAEQAALRVEANPILEHVPTADQLLRHG